MKTNLFTWGLAPDDLEAISKRIGSSQIEVLSDTATEAPGGILLVDASSLPRFVEWATNIERLSGDRPHPVLLFLSSNAKEPADLWDFYDDVVNLKSLDVLEQRVDCPGIAQAELAAADVPTWFLKSLSRPISAVPIAQYPFGSEEWDHPKSEIRRLLAEDARCRMAFNAALEWRLSATATVFDVARTHLEVEFARLAFAERQRQDQRTAVIIGVLAAFMQMKEMSVRRQAARTVHGTRSGRGVELTAPDADITERVRGLLTETTTPNIKALKRYMTSGPSLESNPLQFRLQLTDDSLTFDELVDPSDNDVTNYRVELRRGETIVWHAETRDGVVILPLSKLEPSPNDEPISNNEPIHIAILQLP